MGCLAGIRKRKNRMKAALRSVYCSVMIITLVGLTGLMWGQSPDQQQNLFACSNGWDSCDSSALAPADKKAVANAKREQNICDCENSWTSCNRSTLSTPELVQVEVAMHRKLVSDCWSGIRSCDYAKLTASEAAGVAIAEKQKNASDCWNGWSGCNFKVESIRTERSDGG